MALNVALNAAKESGKTVAVFSLEMSREQLVTRLLASEGLVENTPPHHRRPAGERLGEDRRGRLLPEPVWISASTITPLLTVADMNAKCRRVENLGLVVIDYLQLMTVRRRQGLQRREPPAGGRPTSPGSLKIMAKELNVPVLCLSQLSRANEKP